MTETTKSRRGTTEEVLIREKDPLEGWVIAICGGRAFVGMVALREVLNAEGAVVGHAEDRTWSSVPFDRSIRLSPVFEFNASANQTAQGLAIGHGALPVLLLASITELEVRTDAVIECASLGAGDRTNVVRAVRQATDLQQAMRAAASGIALARAMPVQDRGRG